MRNEPVADTDGRLNDKAILPALQVKALLTECSNPWSDQHKSSFSIRLQELADMTMAHLTPKELEGVFIRPDWMKCASIPSEFAPVFALLDANARRDYVAMEELGRNWLKQPPAIKALRTDFSPLALTSMLYSLAHQNRWNDLLQGVEQYAAGIKVNENQATGLGLLVAVAQNRKLEAKNTP
jgi:spermidine synthase